MKDYSQSGEQKIIRDYFAGKTGTLLDCGANDGETFSMSRALIFDGFKAVLVEPSLAAFTKLAEKYAPNTKSVAGIDYIANPTDGVILAQAAITTSDGPIDLYDSGTHLNKGDVALLSTTVPAEMDRWKKSGEQFTKTTVRGITFATLMKETGVNRFDFVSIDAEGMDILILHQIDLTAVGCQLLCIEYNNSSKTQWAIEQYCVGHGMKLHWKGYENLIFAR